MCYYTSVKTTGRQLAQVLHTPFPEAEQFHEKYFINGFSHPSLPVLSMEGDRSIQLMTWGLIPFWVKDWESAVKLRRQTLNAISEEVFDKPSYRNVIMKQRCIIPVTGFIEWKHVGADKIPHYVHPKEQPYFYLAGIYSRWTNPATRDEHTTYSILTGKANELMTDIHNSKKRQPLMIDRGLINTWIDPTLSKPSVIELMNPCDDTDMAAYTIRRDLTGKNAIGDVPEVLEPVNY